MKRVVLSLLVLGLTSIGFASAEEDIDWIELLRSDLRTEKLGLVTEAMELEPTQGEVFWPIYREYETELAAIGDQRIALIKDYSKHFSVMTEEKVKEISDGWFRLQDAKLKLKKKYFKRLEKALSSGVAARFIQVEHQIGLLADLQIMSQMPLLQPPG